MQDQQYEKDTDFSDYYAGQYGHVLASRIGQWGLQAQSSNLESITDRTAPEEEFETDPTFYADVPDPDKQSGSSLPASSKANLGANLAPPPGMKKANYTSGTNDSANTQPQPVAFAGGLSLVQYGDSDSD